MTEIANSFNKTLNTNLSSIWKKYKNIASKVNPSITVRIRLRFCPTHASFKLIPASPSLFVRWWELHPVLRQRQIPQTVERGSGDFAEDIQWPWLRGSGRWQVRKPSLFPTNHFKCHHWLGDRNLPLQATTKPSAKEMQKKANWISSFKVFTVFFCLPKKTISQNPT